MTNVFTVVMMNVMMCMDEMSMCKICLAKNSKQLSLSACVDKAYPKKD